MRNDKIVNHKSGKIIQLKLFLRTYCQYLLQVLTVQVLSNF